MIHMNEKVVYLCDRKACGEVCPNPENCSHTFNIRHAVNFEPDGYGDTVYYVEKERDENEQKPLPGERSHL